MAKFRKKPVVIDAVEWLPERKPTEFPAWFWDEFKLHPQRFNQATGVLSIPTLEGVMQAQPGDWIIKGVKGEIYPCKPDIFAATYEPE